MGAFVKGAVLVVPFPFADRTGTKRRPVLVLASLPGDDVIVCQITSQSISDKNAVRITNGDFVNGGLQQPSNVRPDHLFTISSRRVLYQLGVLVSPKIDEIITRLVSVLHT